MDINKLIANIKKKIEKNVPLDYIKIEDKSFIHKNHPGNKEGKCHLKILIKSSQLKKISRIDSNKIIYKTNTENISAGDKKGKSRVKMTLEPQKDNE